MMKTLNNYINEALIKKDTEIDKSVYKYDKYDYNDYAFVWLTGRYWHELQPKYDKEGYEKIDLINVLYILPKNIAIKEKEKLSNILNYGGYGIYNIPKDFPFDDIENMLPHEKHELIKKILNNNNQIK